MFNTQIVYDEKKKKSIKHKTKTLHTFRALLDLFTFNLIISPWETPHKIIITYW